MDIPIEYTGLRAGEKLYEELITGEEGILPTTHEKIMVVKCMECDLENLQKKTNSLTEAATTQDDDLISPLYLHNLINRRF